MLAALPAKRTLNHQLSISLSTHAQEARPSSSVPHISGTWSYARYEKGSHSSTILGMVIPNARMRVALSATATEARRNGSCRSRKHFGLPRSLLSHIIQPDRPICAWLHPPLQHAQHPHENMHPE